VIGMKTLAPLGLSLILVLAACSPAAESSDTRVSEAVSDTVVPPTPAPAPAAASHTKLIGLEGLGDLRLGEAPPSGPWASRGAQEPGSCQTMTSPDYPGVYALLTDGKVRRISVGQRSDVKLVEGVGVGSTEEDVLKAFGGFRAEPHKYVDAPAKYLTAPNAASGDPAVRFEIGQDGKVSIIHVGMMPELGYVEGCS
jgi:hypothetical protein